MIAKSAAAPHLTAVNNYRDWLSFSPPLAEESHQFPTPGTYVICVISPECIPSYELSHIQLFWWIFWNKTFSNKEIQATLTVFCFFYWYFSLSFRVILVFLFFFQEHVFQYFQVYSWNIWLISNKPETSFYKRKMYIWARVIFIISSNNPRKHTKIWYGVWGVSEKLL